MKSFVLRISLAASLLILLSLAAALPTRSDSTRAQFNQHSEDVARRRPARGVKPLSYRSPGAAHKLMFPADDPELEQRLVSSPTLRKSRKYGAYSLVEVSDAELNSLNAATLE